MKEYIEKESVKNELNRVEKLYRDTYGSKVRAEMVSYCCEVVRHLPVAYVVEMRHGHWSMLSYDEAICTCCGYNRDTPFDSTREARERWGELPPYCEMCGAKMDEGVEEEE